jgi:hypothetical protein
VSELNADPVAKLAMFTPASAVDANELLFVAGRASARTPWGWKAAVAVLIVSNIALGAFLAFRGQDIPPAPQLVAPSVIPPQPEEVVPPEPQPPASSPTDEPWSYHALMSRDPKNWPKSEPVANLAPSQPLTILSGRRGDID